VLAVTGSAAKAGIVSFARTLPWALFALPAGVAADRWNRKRLMILADGVRVLAIGSLAATILLHRIAFWAIPLVAFVEGTGAALFSAAQAGALRAVVPARQLPAAAGAQTGRQAVVRLAGPRLAERSSGSPACSRSLSTRAPTPSRSSRCWRCGRHSSSSASPTARRCARGLGKGFASVGPSVPADVRGAVRARELRRPGVLLAVVVVGKRQGLSGGEVGALVAAFGACLLLGSLVAPLARRLLPVRAVLLLELWTWLGCALFLVWPNVYALTASILPTALAIPSTDSVVNGYRIAMTPDRLLGRVESVRSTISLLIAPLGPLAAGALLDATSARATIAFFAVFGLVLAIWGTLSPSIRAAPSLDELDDLPGGGTSTDITSTAPPD
jgi:MFS family permease